MVDKQKAIQLRQEGKSYKEIAEELSCSEAWCKLNLKGVVKNTQEASAIQECIGLALRTEGITTQDIFKRIEALYTFEENKDGNDAKMTVYRRFKDKIQKVPNTIIRPYWMKPKSSIEIFQRVLGIVNTMDDRLLDEIRSLQHDFELDDSYINSLSFIIGKLSYAGSIGSAESLKTRLANLEVVATKLSNKNKDTTHQKQEVFSIPDTQDIDTEFDVPY